MTKAVEVITSVQRRRRWSRAEKERIVAAALAIAAEPAPASPAMSEPGGTIEIEFATGGRMRITGPVDARTVSALMKALAKGKRRQ
jgi:transposase